MKKNSFNPEITRIKLNPEQAVLLCACYRGTISTAARTATVPVCNRATPSKDPLMACAGRASGRAAIS